MRKILYGVLFSLLQIVLIGFAHKAAKKVTANANYKRDYEYGYADGWFDAFYRNAFAVNPTIEESCNGHGVSDGYKDGYYAGWDAGYKKKHPDLYTQR